MGQRHTTSQVHLFDVAATSGSIPMFHWVQFARNIKAYLLGKNKKDITSLSSAEVAQRVVKVFTSQSYKKSNLSTRQIGQVHL